MKRGIIFFAGVVFLLGIPAVTQAQNNEMPAIYSLLLKSFWPPIGTTSDEGVIDGADWQLCRANKQTAWVSSTTGGGKYNLNAACKSLGYDGTSFNHGGNCDTVCGYCGTPGLEIYDGAGADWPFAMFYTVVWECRIFQPPLVGSTGTVGVNTGADWTVCRADKDTAWVASQGSGTYDAEAACAELGYLTADKHGGNCGTVCGYCGTPGEETYDNNGAVWPNDYGATVHWRCNNFVPPAVDTFGTAGVLSGADWQVCRADEDTAWISSQSGGGTYDAEVICAALGYKGADLHGGNCDTVCGYCGTPGQETYDNQGLTWPNDYGFTVNWRCTNL